MEKKIEVGKIAEFRECFLGDLDSHRVKYQSFSDAARNFGDDKAYREAEIKLGILKMSAALFELQYRKIYGN